MHRYKIAKLRGTFKRAKSKSVLPFEFTILRLLIIKHKNIRIYIDIMLKNNISFL